MITEDYCSFEVAKLLKEKGFDGECSKFYMPTGNGRWKYAHYHDFDISDRIDCPTLQMAMKWLREIRNIAISIFPTIETDMIVREDYSYAIYKNKTVVYQGCSISHEEAAEAALKYSLENLI